MLDERPSHRAPATRFREELEDYMSEDYADRTLRTVINLGRYGELFAYDENAQTFSYEEPRIGRVCPSCRFGLSCSRPHSSPHFWPYAENRNDLH